MGPVESGRPAAKEAVTSERRCPAARAKAKGKAGTADARAAKLRRELDDHNHRYYVLDDPEIRIRSTTTCCES